MNFIQSEAIKFVSDWIPIFSHRLYSTLEALLGQEESLLFSLHRNSMSPLDLPTTTERVKLVLYYVWDRIFKREI